MPKTLTFADWAGDTGRRDRLAALLDNPVFKDAVNTLSSAFAEAAPSIVGTNSEAPIPNAVDLNNLLALRFAHRSGFFGFVKALGNLTKERPLRPTRDILPSMVPEGEPVRKPRKP